MMASVASRAPSTPPLTGQSRNSACRERRSSAHLRAVSELTVEQSMTKRARLQARRERGNDVEHVLVRRDAKHDGFSDSRKLGRRSRRIDAQLSREGLRAFLGVRFQTPTSRPAAVKVARHVRAHGPETDESHTHDTAPAVQSGLNYRASAQARDAIRSRRCACGRSAAECGRHQHPRPTCIRACRSCLPCRCDGSAMALSYASCAFLHCSALDFATSCLTVRDACCACDRRCSPVARKDPLARRRRAAGVAPTLSVFTRTEPGTQRSLY